MIDLKTIQNELYSLGNTEKIESAKRYFKTKKGQYAEADVFLGINLPQLRSLSLKFLDINLNQLQVMLFSKFHEERMLALLILVNRFQKSKSHTQKDEIFQFYTNWDNIMQVNNWDLVDTSCRIIIGVYLMNNPLQLDLLTRLALSDSIWLRRISIVSTFEFIQNDKFDTTYKISNLLLNDDEDMIQKAVGWMLKEIGKRDKNSEINFLFQHRGLIPPKIMRFATENFSTHEKDLLRKFSKI